MTPQQLSEITTRLGYVEGVLIGATYTHLVGGKLDAVDKAIVQVGEVYEMLRADVFDGAPADLARELAECRAERDRLREDLATVDGIRRSMRQWYKSEIRRLRDAMLSAVVDLASAPSLSGNFTADEVRELSHAADDVCCDLQAALANSAPAPPAVPRPPMQDQETP